MELDRQGLFKQTNNHTQLNMSSLYLFKHHSSAMFKLSGLICTIVIYPYFLFPGMEFTWRGKSSGGLQSKTCLPHPTVHHTANMLCWGNAKDGQLGIGPDNNPVFEPRSCHVFSGRGLKEIACGGQHSLFLLHDGSVYTCGSNSCGQLGHNKPGIHPGRFTVWATWHYDHYCFHVSQQCFC